MSKEDNSEVASVPSINTPNLPDQDMSDIDLKIYSNNNFCEMIKRKKLIFSIIGGIIGLLIIIIPTINIGINNIPINSQAFQ